MHCAGCFRYKGWFAVAVWLLLAIPLHRAGEGHVMNYTYIVKCSDGTYYTGWTNDLERRIRVHNEGKGAKYTRSRGPVELVYYEGFDTKEEAMSREARIKRLTRKEKEQLIKKKSS